MNGPPIPRRHRAARRTPADRAAAAPELPILRPLPAALGPSAAILLALLASACVETGDFGRPRPSLWNDVALPATGSIAARLRGEPVSSYVLTDDEDELRRRAWRFVMPAHERSFFERQLAELVRARVLPVHGGPAFRASYFHALMRDGGASPSSRYRRLAEDVVADAKLMAPFALTAARVLKADEARLRGLAYVQDLTAWQAGEAALRVAENRCLIAWVRWEIDARAASYRYALEHLFIEAPQADGVAVERSLALFEAQRTVLDGLPGGPWPPSCGLPASAEPMVATPAVAAPAAAVVVKD